MVDPADYDAASVRGLYPSLGDGWTYLNAHDRPQIPERISSAVARAFRHSATVTRAEVQTGQHAREQEAGESAASGFFAAARAAVADLVGGSSDAVVLGPSLPVLYRSLARAMRPMLRRSSSIVLSGLDDDALTSAFDDAAAEFRWAQPDLGTGELPGWQYRELVDGSTRLVAFSAAQGLIGTVAPVEEITDEVRSRSRAWVLVDASAYAPYRFVDIEEWNSDIVAIDLAQLGGPQMSALVFRDARMFNRLDGLNPSHGLETPLSSGLAGGVSATVDHLAGFVDTPDERTRRESLKHSMAALDSHLDALRDDLYLFLGSLPAVHIMGLSGEAAAEADKDRLPRVSFAVRGVPAETVQRRLIDNGLVTTIAPNSRLLREMGVEEVGGAVTVALGPFNTNADLDHLIRVVASLA